MYERIKTVVLFLLMLLGVVQFAMLVISGQDPVRVVGRETASALVAPSQAAQNAQTPLELQTVADDSMQSAALTTVLAVPPRMIAHVPDAPSLISSVPVDHVLLRSNSRYYTNLWNRALDVLTSSAQVSRAQFVAVEPEVWNPDIYALELILGQPTPLRIYLDLLGVTLEGNGNDESDNNGADGLILDRIYISAHEDDTVYLSDISGTIYQSPWRSRSSVFLPALKACELSSLAIQPLDAQALGFQTFREVYVLSSPVNATTFSIVPLVNEEEFKTIAPRLFQDPVSLRSSAENVPFFEDAEQRVRLNGTQLVFERQWWLTSPSVSSTVSSTASSSFSSAVSSLSPLWNEVATLLEGAALWPEEDLFFDGLAGSPGQAVFYLQQVYRGRPVYYLEPESSIAQATLRAEGQAGRLTALRFRPSQLRNTLYVFPVQSQQQILRDFVLHFSSFTHGGQGGDQELPVFRDIYEGYVYRSGSEATEVWVLEFIDGSRYLVDMASGSFIAYVPAPALR